MGNFDMPLNEATPQMTSRMPILSAIRTILLSIICFFILDNLIFRSHLYARLIEPDTTQGMLLDVEHFLHTGPKDFARDVLFIGNSKTAEGFSVADFEQMYPNATIHLLLGATSGSNLETWYYELRELDPKHSRYRAIVIPLEGYQAAPVAYDEQNQYGLVQTLAPTIGLHDWQDFRDNFTDPTLRVRASEAVIFSSHDYSLDLQELLLHPIHRIQQRIQRDHDGLNWLRDFRGYPGTVEGLKIDPATGRPTAYPWYFDTFQKYFTYSQFISPTIVQAKSWTARDATFEATWLRRIVSDYKGSRTTLIFINIPHWPLILPAVAPIPGAPDVRAILPASPNIAVLPENDFADLEQPRYFIDMVHMNAAGRLLFTRRLGQRLQDLIRPSS